MIIETLDPNATYTVTGNKDFVVGNNEVIIEVTSSDGLQKETYTIQVNRNMSSNNYLSYILPSKGALSPAFTKTNNNYTLTVENDITQINIDAEPEDSNATMVGNGDYTLEVGENKIEIKVTNLWPNRLIGDQFLPEAERYTQTNISKYTRQDTLRPSGLLGPVRLMIIPDRDEF